MCSGDNPETRSCLVLVLIGVFDRRHDQVGSAPAFYEVRYSRPVTASDEPRNPQVFVGGQRISGAGR